MINGVKMYKHSGSFETRKIQITGGSTYIISLPKKWVEKAGVKNGDYVVLNPQSDGTLLISPQIEHGSNKPKKSITIDYDETEKMTRKFIAAYLSGYDIIEFRSKNRLTPPVRQRIRDLSQYAIGPEIIDETMTSMTVQDLIDAGEFSLKNGLRRMHVITREMHRDAIIALKEKDTQLAKDVESRDDEVDKLYWMIAKQYNLILQDVFFAEKMGITSSSALSYLLIARAIERIADHAKKFAENVENLTSDISIIPKIITLSDRIMEIFDGSMNAFYRNRFDDANAMVDKAKKLGEEVEKIQKKIIEGKNNTLETISVAFIIDSLERTRSYGMDIAEITLNHHLTLQA
jgi:phosphate uptake regulator